ncbi:hypothetical protein GE061_009518 [Apolygus lucorum]|uniref:Immunoglobulin I-set domain-containing protein n=1 Tax=Apolygus lucorum TaxID=248454 RepID=A0A8S9Y4J0_APOLU|nr:hypothetical protein GE061_009518 [Apolygus lucorum]
MIVTSDKYETKVSVRSIFETKMTLKVHHLQKVDVGTYRCIAKNSLGEVERSIRLYEIPGSVTRKAPSTAVVLTEDQEEEEEEEEEAGSAEKALPETPPPHRHHDHQVRANLDEPPPTAASSALPTHRHLLALLALASSSI